jgi:hypothetical protein
MTVRPDLAILVRAGSHAYGTERPDSDDDYRGVYLVPTVVRGLAVEAVSGRPLRRASRGCRARTARRSLPAAPPCRRCWRSCGPTC